VFQVLIILPSACSKTGQSPEHCYSSFLYLYFLLVSSVPKWIQPMAI